MKLYNKYILLNYRVKEDQTWGEKYRLYIKIDISSINVYL